MTSGQPPIYQRIGEAEQIRVRKKRKKGKKHVVCELMISMEKIGIYILYSKGKSKSKMSYSYRQAFFDAVVVVVVVVVWWEDERIWSRGIRVKKGFDDNGW